MAQQSLRVLRAITGEWVGQLINHLYKEISLPWKLTKTLCESATYNRNTKLLGSYKLCFPQGKKNRSSTALVFMHKSVYGC